MNDGYGPRKAQLVMIEDFDDFFKDQDKSFYTTGIQALQHHWKKWVDRRGDYGEKNTFVQIRLLHHSQLMNFSAHSRKIEGGIIQC